MYLPFLPCWWCYVSIQKNVIPQVVCLFIDCNEYQILEFKKVNVADYLSNIFSFSKLIKILGEKHNICVVGVYKHVNKWRSLASQLIAVLVNVYSAFLLNPCCFGLPLIIHN